MSPAALRRIPPGNCEGLSIARRTPNDARTDPDILAGTKQHRLKAALLVVLLLPSLAIADSYWQCDSNDSGVMRCEASGPLLPGAGSAADSGDLDWRSNTDAAHQVGPSNEVCPGNFVEPNPGGTEAQLNPRDAPLRVSADDAEILEDQSHVSLTGNVGLQQGYRSIRAEQLDYFRDQDRIELSNGIEVREPGILLRGETAELNPRTGEARLDKAQYVLHKIHAHGSAKQISRDKDDIVTVHKGSYTYCPPGNDDWILRAKRIRLDADAGYGVARDAQLRLGDVPVIYTPYFRFPTDDRRMSGFLWPHLGFTAGSGLDVSIPYYFNLAPDYDATLLPRYIGDRGLMTSAETRYLNHWGESLLAGSFLLNDDETGEHRWLTRLDHRGNRFGTLSTHIDYTKVSDDNYFQDLSAGGLQVRRMAQLNQQATANYRAGKWSLLASVQEFQTVDDDLVEPYRMLPRLQVLRDFEDQPFKLDYRLLAQYTHFDEPSGDAATGDRLYIEPGLRLPMRWTAGFVIPTLKFRQLAYSLDNQAAPWDDSPRPGSAVASLDSGLYFERLGGLFGDGFVQTLEPRLYYLTADQEDHDEIPDFDTANLTFSFSQLFRDTRFSGYDRLADANQLSLALTTRFIDAGRGIEKFSASVGQIRYFDDREVTVFDRQADSPSASKSQIATEISYRPGANSWVDASILWDPTDENVDEGGLQYHWSDQRYLINLGYRYRRQVPLPQQGKLLNNDIDQADISGVLPVGDRWKLVARYQYDFTEEQNIEQLFGLEYSSCCWAIRALYQEGLDRDGERDEGFFLEFVLFGLGGIGDSINNVLRKSIREYDRTGTDHGI